MVVLEQICARLLATQAVWIHRIQATGGASGSITMVVMFVVCLCCCVVQFFLVVVTRM